MCSSLRHILFFSLSLLFDGTRDNKIIAFHPTSFINYPGFPTDTLRTDSLQFCTIADKITNCDSKELQKIIFIFNTTDSTMEQSSDDARHILINKYQIKSIEIDSISQLKFSRYVLVSKLKEYENNVYVIEKLFGIDCVRMYVITHSEIYRVYYFHF